MRYRHSASDNFFARRVLRECRLAAQPTGPRTRLQSLLAARRLRASWEALDRRAAKKSPGGSDEPGPLYGVIAVHQLDAQPLGLGVDHQRVPGGEANEGIPAGLLVQMGARHIEHGIPRVERLRHQLTHDTLTQTGEQHEMP